MGWKTRGMGFQHPLDSSWNLGFPSRVLHALGTSWTPSSGPTELSLRTSTLGQGFHGPRRLRCTGLVLMVASAWVGSCSGGGNSLATQLCSWRTGRVAPPHTCSWNLGYPGCL